LIQTLKEAKDEADNETVQMKTSKPNTNATYVEVKSPGGSFN
jgi:hypothetical protein